MHALKLGQKACLLVQGPAGPALGQSAGHANLAAFNGNPVSRHVTILSKQRTKKVTAKLCISQHHSQAAREKPKRCSASAL